MNPTEAKAMVRRLAGVYGDWPFPQERIDECVNWFRRLPKALGEGVVDRFTEVYDEVPKNIIKALGKIRTQVDEHGDFRVLMDRMRRAALDSLRFRKNHFPDGDHWTLRRVLEGMIEGFDTDIVELTHTRKVVDGIDTWTPDPERADRAPDWMRQRLRACRVLLEEINDPYGAEHHYPVSSEEARDAEQQAMKGMA